MSSPPLILGMIVRNEAAMLAQTLPKLTPFIDGIVAIDAESTDTTAGVLMSVKALGQRRAWNGSYCDARNACIDFARQHFDGAIMLMLDADECMTARDLVALRAAVSDTPSLALARYEFVDDYFHFNPHFYPDFQARVFPLDGRYRYRGALHEQLFYADETATALSTGRSLYCPYLHIFHYGKCKPLPQVWLKYENYRRHTAGEPLLDAVPAGAAIPSSFSHGTRLVFHGERPL